MIYILLIIRKINEWYSPYFQHFQSGVQYSDIFIKKLHSKANTIYKQV